MVEAPADSPVTTRLLSKVVAETYSSGVSESMQSRLVPWSSSYDVATWLSTPHDIKKPVHLILEYVDHRGRHQVIVDKGVTNVVGEIMLSGVVSIRAVGKISKMELYAKGPIASNRYEIDEVFVKRRVESKKPARGRTPA